MANRRRADPSHIDVDIVGLVIRRNCDRYFGCTGVRRYFDRLKLPKREVLADCVSNQPTGDDPNRTIPLVSRGLGQTSVLVITGMVATLTLPDRIHAQSNDCILSILLGWNGPRQEWFQPCRKSPIRLTYRSNRAIRAKRSPERVNDSHGVSRVKGFVLESHRHFSTFFGVSEV